MFTNILFPQEIKIKSTSAMYTKLRSVSMWFFILSIIVIESRVVYIIGRLRKCIITQKSTYKLEIKGCLHLKTTEM